MIYDIFDRETALSIVPGSNGGYLLAIVVPSKGYYVLKIDDAFNLDQGFGLSGGFLIETQLPFFSGNPIITTPNGDIYYSSLYRYEDNTHAVWKYGIDGVVDVNFSRDGVAELQYKNTTFQSTLTLEGGGSKIYSIGWGAQYNADGRGLTGAIVLRLNSDGSTDTAYGVNGLNLFELGGFSTDRVIDAVVGTNNEIFIGINIDGRDASVLKLNSNGVLDKSFGVNGVAKVDLDIYDGVFDIDIQSDGKILMMGGSSNGHTGVQFVARFLSNGALDSTFGIGGVRKIANSEMYPSGGSIYLFEDGSIAGIGSVFNQDGAGYIGTFKLNVSGDIDTSYSSNGAKIISLSAAEKVYGFLALESGFVAVGNRLSNSESSPTPPTDILLISIDESGDRSTLPSGEAVYSYLSDVIVDGGILGPSAILLKDLYEEFVYKDGVLVSHTISYESSKFDYSLIDESVMVAVRNDDFTSEFLSEIGDIYPSFRRISYYDAVSLVGVNNIEQSILFVAGVDGFYVG